MIIKLLIFISLTCLSHCSDLLPHLSGYEWKLKSKHFLNQDQDIAQQLMDISIDQKLRYHIRVRAIIALSLFKEERVILFLEQQIKENQKSSTLVRQLSSLSIVSSQQGDRFVRSAKHLISNKSDHVRLSVAKSLKAIDTRSARSLLKTQASNESNPIIKDFIENGRIY